MGVYINGIEMPRGCLTCRFNRYSSIDGHKYCCNITENFVGNWSDRKFANQRHMGCPLMELKEREDGLYERIH